MIFSDISEDCLEHCSSFVESVGMRDRSEFVVAAIEDLSAFADASVDVVTTRSVLIYSGAKQKALSEFFRVLKPGGRLSIFEPINRFESDAAKGGMELKIQVMRGRRGDWDLVLNSAPNPLALSLQEAVDRALDCEESERFLAHMKSMFDTIDVSHRSALAYMVAIKSEAE